MHIRPKGKALCYGTAFNVTEDMAAWIEMEASRLGVSMSDVIRECVQRAMNEDAGKATIKGKTNDQG